jgi:tetratricopeptide (TPR) repeat protein
MYEKGIGVPKDDAEAVRWYRQAAEQGEAKAQYNLGTMYDFGSGVPEDDAEAVRWYRQAADQGNVSAQEILGLMYANGAGVPEDLTEAFRWFSRAAARGHALSQARVAAMLIEQGKPDAALAAAREAVNLDPKLSTAHEILCGILMSMEKIENAVASCSEALALDPENPYILNDTAWILVTTDDPHFRDPQKGLLLALRSVEASSGQEAAILDTLGEAYFANGRFDEAIDAEKRAIALDPENETLQKQLQKFEQARLAEANN